MVIIALLNMQARESDSPMLDQAFKVTQERIYAMSLVYDQLQKSDNVAAIDLRHYITTLSQKLHTSIAVDPGRIRFEVECDSIPISLIQAVPVGIILNEIISNSLEHAFPEKRAGHITVSARVGDDEMLSLNISDDGVGMSDDLINKKRESLGLRLVSMLAEDQLAGKHELISSRGITHGIEFKLLGS